MTDCKLSKKLIKILTFLIKDFRVVHLNLDLTVDNVNRVKLGDLVKENSNLLSVGIGGSKGGGLVRFENLDGQGLKKIANFIKSGDFENGLERLKKKFEFLYQVRTEDQIVNCINDSKWVI